MGGLRPVRQSFGRRIPRILGDADQRIRQGHRKCQRLRRPCAEGEPNGGYRAARLAGAATVRRSGRGVGGNWRCPRDGRLGGAAQRGVGGALLRHCAIAAVQERFEAAAAKAPDGQQSVEAEKRAGEETKSARHGGKLL